MKIFSVILGAAVIALVLAGPATAWDSVTSSTEKGYSAAEMRPDAHSARMSPEKETMHHDARGYMTEEHDSDIRSDVALSIEQSRENGAM